MDYSTMLQTLKDEHAQKLQELAANFRQEVMIPLCRDHGFEFVQGMGTYFFGPGPELRKGMSNLDSTNFTFSTPEDVEDLEERVKCLIEEYEADDEEIPEHFHVFADLSAFDEVMEFLNEEFEHNQFMGYLVNDIRQSDY